MFFLSRFKFFRSRFEKVKSPVYLEIRIQFTDNTYMTYRHILQENFKVTKDFVTITSSVETAIIPMPIVRMIQYFPD